MKKSLAIVTLAVTALGVAACGDGGGSGGSDLSSAQSDAAAATLRSAKDSGIELDESCVNDVVAKLSDDDAAKVAAADGADADLSAEGEALAGELIACADDEAIMDMIIESLAASGQAFDEACVRDALADVDMAELVATAEGDEPPAAFVTAMMTCLSGG